MLNTYDKKDYNHHGDHLAIVQAIIGIRNFNRHIY